jgi:hypothetical protein
VSAGLAGAWWLLDLEFRLAWGPLLAFGRRTQDGPPIAEGDSPEHGWPEHAMPEHAMPEHTTGAREL